MSLSHRTQRSNNRDEARGKQVPIHKLNIKCSGTADTSVLSRAMHEHREARFALRGLQKAATQTLPSAVHTVRIVYELQVIGKMGSELQ